MNRIFDYLQRWLHYTFGQPQEACHHMRRIHRSMIEFETLALKEMHYP